jgi:serine/threonine-protein kinase
MIGETVGNYRLVLRLGSGAMGTVFLGEHERIARRAAIKVLSPELARDTAILERFFVEARATSLIRHPAIVEVLDCGVHAPEQRPYIVMEHVPGETLSAHLERAGRLDWRDACATARQIADGLAAAHDHRIVHRDVKPANVMLAGGDPRAPIVKLLDFGVAKLLQETLSRTHPGELLGTPEYMAPEQCGGEGAIGERTDIYGLGCVLFEMICGRLPFPAKRLGELILAHQWAAPPLASAYAQLPPALDRLIAGMLAKRPEDRPADMASVARVLGELLEERRPPAQPAPRRRFPRGLALAVAGGVALVTIAVAHAARHGKRAAPRVPVVAIPPAPPVPRAVEVVPPPPVPPPAVARPVSPPRHRRAGHPLQVDANGIVQL